jgi:DNA polymerase I
MLDRLAAAGFHRGGWLAVACQPGAGIGLAGHDFTLTAAVDDPFAAVAEIDDVLRPRWVWWSIDTPLAFTKAGVRVATCWDVATVHRLLFGGWRADVARIWSTMHGLPAESIPVVGQLDLAGGHGGEATGLQRADGHLDADWIAGGWADSPDHLGQWAAAALTVCDLQQQRLEALAVRGNALATARSESAAELLCAELTVDGLPVDVAAAERLIERLVGPRARSDRESAELRARRDAAVLDHVPSSGDVDLRNPAQVKNLLRRVGIEVTDTRAWRLESLRDQHPVIEALLQWRKAERVATTYGYSWLDEHVGANGRLRGAWSGTDGAAGRMTAQAGLHNMPVDMREIVAADPGHVFVRADLGQIEPRVLAAVSGDTALTRATVDNDLYAPVAKRLGVERSAAKVAVLAAMYGQTSGVAGQALRGLEQAYPVAMRFLQDADEIGQAGNDLRTFGGRLVRMWHPANDDGGGDAGDVSARAVAAARGRFARNAMVQGAAAELFKVWAAIVRARATAYGARIVLCLHDELLVHTPEPTGEDVKQLLSQCLDEAARLWAPNSSVRFVADASVIRRWSDAKG